MPGQEGLIHLYTGGGKGKTTSAIGMCVRALGHQRRVLFCQFLKAAPSGELKPLEALGATVRRASAEPRFLKQLSPKEREAVGQSHRQCLELCRREIKAGLYDLVVLDEVVDALNGGALEFSALLELLRNRPRATEVVLTGHNPSLEIQALADYHTDFVCIRHPYSGGVAAREGIEY